jgi:hypothetical protein
MILLGAMAIGALVGAVAGVAVYGVKTAISKEKTWSWKAAAAHAAGGVVGGGLFPAIFAGLAAVGLPVAAAYILAGGVAWGGIWSLAQDAASWGLGLEKGLRSPGRYVAATAIGLLATAILFPFAARAVGNSGLVRHAGTVNSYITPSANHVPASIVKSEAEFLAFGAMAEFADTGLNRAANEIINSVAERELAKREEDSAEEPDFSVVELGPIRGSGPIETHVMLDPLVGPRGSFGTFLEREGIAPADATRVELPQPALPQRTGIQHQLLGLSAR